MPGPDRSGAEESGRRDPPEAPPGDEPAADESAADESSEDGSPEDKLDALFAGDPDVFVSSRQALAKKLRAAGDKERAATVAGLRRPTVAAWAVNQLARRHPRELRGLLDLGEQLGRAHEQLLQGTAGADSALSIGRQRREAVSALADLAGEILESSGRAAAAHRDAIAATLDAASLDPSQAPPVRAGRLSKELDPPSGLGFAGAEAGWAAPSTGRRAGEGALAGAPPEAEDETDEAAREASAASAEAARLRRVEEARQRAETAKGAAERARALADRAQEAADDAAEHLELLEEQVAAARRAANDARRTARELRQEAVEAAARAERLGRAAEEAEGGRPRRR